MPPINSISPGRGVPLLRYPLASASLLLLSLFSLVNARKCPEENQEEIDHHGFFQHGLNVGGWDAHHIGWAVAGVAASIATIASFSNIYLHCKNYNKPLEQRQIVRILLMPAIYSISSFFAYRYYRHYVYFAVIRDTYEAFVLASFLILCLLYVGRSPLEQHEVMKQKEKSPLVFPFCCYRYRPSKPYFLLVTKWSVLQYVILRPLLSAAALITDTQGLFCASSYSPDFANLWITILIFTSATIALYGLLIIYHLAKEDLQGHRPMMKFMSIKIAVFLVFYQSFLLSFFDRLGYFKATEYWSQSNIADGVNALATTIEMATIGVFQLFAYPYTEYRALIKGSEINRKKSVWNNFLHSQDYRDFGYDIIWGLRFFMDRIRGRDHRKAPPGVNPMDFQAAFGLDPEHARIRDPEWESDDKAITPPSLSSSHHKHPASESELHDVWDSRVLEEEQKQSFEVTQEFAYESIRLGEFEVQHAHKMLVPRPSAELHQASVAKYDQTDDDSEFYRTPSRDSGGTANLLGNHHNRRHLPTHHISNPFENDPLQHEFK